MYAIGDKRPLAIAIGDNHPLFRLAIVQVLSDPHPESTVREADGFEQLMALLREESFDLVIADLGMPGYSWLMLDDVVRAAATAPVVAFSARIDAEHARALLSRGVRGYVPKVSTPAAVRSALRRVLAGDVFIPAELEATPAVQRRGGVRMTSRQENVLRAIGDGDSIPDIADKLGISEATVKLHLRGAIRAMGARNRTMAVLIAERRGLFRDSRHDA